MKYIAVLIIMALGEGTSTSWDSGREFVFSFASRILNFFIFHFFFLKQKNYFLT